MTTHIVLINTAAMFTIIIVATSPLMPGKHREQQGKHIERNLGLLKSSSTPSGVSPQFFTTVALQCATAFGKPAP